jgi:4-hydroxythreonine-4-phosphate dehydrogenase
MKFEPILIFTGEPNSIFSEILIKSLKKIKIKKPIIVISSQKLLIKQLKNLKLKKKIRLLNYKNLKNYQLDNKTINLIDVDYNQIKAFEKISSKSKKFIENSFKTAFRIIKKEKIYRFINGPISKKYFLNKKHLGITEYISNNFKKKNTCMLIFNKKLSVCPVTTHLPLKLVSKKIDKKNIQNKVVLIHKFYKDNLKKIPRIGILGLNPHCESILKYNEDEKIIKPLVYKMKKIGYKINGPISADTIFLKNNRKNYDVIIGMYHDQVLTPIKTLFEYDAINITLGLPFLRISPDHGPNEKMMGKNLSNPLSLIKAIQFLDKH